MREIRQSGSVRGVRRNPYPYRDDGSVTKHTTMLVIGDQDLRKLAGHDKSSKHMKAEQLIGNGQQIRILGESDFMRIVSRTDTPIQISRL